MPSQIGAWEFQLEKVNGKMIPETKGRILEVCAMQLWKGNRKISFEHAQKYIWKALHIDLPLACPGRSDPTVISNCYFSNSG